MVTSRVWFTATQKAELWERWKSGSSAAAISRALDRTNKTGVLRIVTLHGGIAPAPRRRALAALRLEEREEISRGIAVGQSLRQIALGLRRAPSTVSREIRRNGGSQGYRASQSDRRAWQRALRPNPRIVAVPSDCCPLVRTWSTSRVPVYLDFGENEPDGVLFRLSPGSQNGWSYLFPMQKGMFLNGHLEGQFQLEEECAQIMAQAVERHSQIMRGTSS
jgi:hypothetical protein